MAAEEDTERVTVRTYVPAYQRERWREYAEERGMSQSEFVRTMVQAGIRDFDVGGENAVEPDERPSDPGGSGLEDRVLRVLREEGHCSWDDLVAGLTDDIEQRLDETLEELQRENRVAYSGRRGGYTVVDDE